MILCYHIFFLSFFTFQIFQRQIAELTDELDFMKNEKVSIVDRLREREKTLADTKMALSNLQNVLRDIGVDHEAQVLQYKNTIAELKKNIEVCIFSTYHSLLIKKKAALICFSLFH